jgi:glucans biosynthesis protein C
LAQMHNAHERLHGLDAVRASALLLGIWLHASMSFWAPPGVWATVDRSTGTAAYILGFHYIHMFRLAAFFFMAGFFGRLVYHRRGPRGFLRDRFKRILVPLVCGWMVFYPLIVLVWIWGAVRAGAVLAPGTEKLPLWQIWTGALATGAVFRDGIRPAHFWFLYYLLQMYALALVARPLLGPLRSSADRMVRVAMGKPAGPVLLAVPIAVALYGMRSPGGLRTPDLNLRPDPLVLLAYGTPFAFGWLLHRQPELLALLARRWWAYLAVGIAAGTVPFAISSRMAAAGNRAWPASDALTFAATYALGMVFLSLGFTGTFLRWLSRPVPAIRYLSDAAYWLYIAHLPLVAALQVACSRWPLHWSLKWAMILVVALPVLLLSYQYQVRYSYIGRVLNGPRERGQLLRETVPRQECAARATGA